MNDSHMKRNWFLRLMAAIPALCVPLKPQQLEGAEEHGVETASHITVSPAVMPYDTTSVTIDGYTYQAQGGRSPLEHVQNLTRVLNSHPRFKRYYTAVLEGSTFTIARR